MRGGGEEKKRKRRKEEAPLKAPKPVSQVLEQWEGDKTEVSVRDIIQLASLDD